MWLQSKKQEEERRKKEIQNRLRHLEEDARRRRDQSASRNRQLRTSNGSEGPIPSFPRDGEPEGTKSRPLSAREGQFFDPSGERSSATLFTCDWMYLLFFVNLSFSSVFPSTIVSLFLSLRFVCFRFIIITSFWWISAVIGWGEFCTLCTFPSIDWWINELIFVFFLFILDSFVEKRELQAICSLFLLLNGCDSVSNLYRDLPLHTLNKSFLVLLHHRCRVLSIVATIGRLFNEMLSRMLWRKLSGKEKHVSAKSNWKRWRKTVGALKFNRFVSSFSLTYFPLVYWKFVLVIKS